MKQIRLYSSSVQPGLNLSAEFYVPGKPRPLCLFFHGWHMTAAQSARAGYINELTPYFFVINVDMRGRGAGGGKPDASGSELLDALDAIRFAQKTWPQAIDVNVAPKLVGGSGGGGNVLALVGKAPDIFSAGASWAAMSDYALWFKEDVTGQGRDEMEGKGWIGGTPENNPAGYRSRGGLHLLENVLTPLLVIHGRRDEEVRVSHAEMYKSRAEILGKSNVRFIFNSAGHASEQWPEIILHLRSCNETPLLPQNGILKVHGFLACRSFWLMFDHPDGMGTVKYKLNAQGRLVKLEFTPDKDQPPPAFTVRLFEKPAIFNLMRQSDKVSLSPVSLRPGYVDYKWSGAGQWTVAIH